MEEFMLMRATPSKIVPVENEDCDLYELIRTRLEQDGFLLANHGEAQERGVKFVIAGHRGLAFKQPVDLMMENFVAARRNFESFLISRDQTRAASTIYFLVEETTVSRLGYVVGAVAADCAKRRRRADRVLVAKLDNLEDYVLMTPEVFRERLKCPEKMGQIKVGQVAQIGPHYLIAEVQGTFYKIFRQEAIYELQSEWRSTDWSKNLMGRKVSFVTVPTNTLGSIARLER